MGLVPAKSAAGFFCMMAAAVFFLPGLCAAASPGNFPAMFPEKPGGVSSFMALQTERQVNEFPAQRDRGPEVDAQGEERHYSEIRKSENTFSFDGIKTGAAFGNWPLVYVIAGFGRADVDFSFTDELTEQKDEYSRQVRFENEGFPVFGCGISAVMHRTEVMGKDFRFGGDLQYRRLDFEAGKGALSYESDLHEIQIALAATLEDVSWQPPWLPATLVFSPYGGTKVSHFIGSEKFSDPENVDRRGDPDPIYYSGDLDPANHITYFFGTNLDLPRSFFLGVETRFGDDEGYGVQLGCIF
ncbi:MAG: hypothetical protein K9K82_11890 [Desulfobacteraceae bacterium]|nr:hypothetical protein [Desulfobacteraceae bacterium]